ncbi:hypothetical protein HMPREF9531_04601, partial [Escherichia coli MS 45-1]
VEILLSDAQHHVVFRLFRMTGQEPAKVASGFRIHQRTDGFDKIHTKPGLSAVEGVVMFPRQTKQDPPYPGAGLLTQRTLKDADDFVLIRWPEGCQAIVEIRNSIHKICSVMRSPQCVLPVNELTCYGLRMRLME